jgi:hypothetical protein
VKPGEHSVLRIVVTRSNKTTKWPDGCLLRLVAEPDLSLVVRIEDTNNQKYRVVFDGKTEKLADDQAVPAALATFLGIPGPSLLEKKKAGSPDPGTQSLFETQTPPWVSKDDALEKALLEFQNASRTISDLVLSLKAANEAIPRAEDYRSLMTAVREALAGDQPHFKECLAGAGGCAKELLNLPTRLEEDVKELTDAKNALVDTARQVRTALEAKYIEEAAQAKVDAALKVADGIPGLAKRVAVLFDEDATLVSLFTSQETFDFKGDPLRVRVRVEAGESAKPTTIYGLEVRLEPKRASRFVFSSGFMFTTVVDREYAVSDGKIVEKGDTDDVHAGVGVLAHWIFGSWKSAHFAASAGIMGTDSELQYLIGPSILFGSKQHFVITGGVSIGSALRLDNVALGDPFSESTVPTTDVTRAGAFAGVSFKF